MFFDKKYWERYYNRKTKIDIGYNNPSDFAKFTIENLEKSENHILELGCGNGRDSIFFSENNQKVFAIDQCANTTEVLNVINNNLSSKDYDFTKLPNDINFTPNVIYSRFTLHSIDHEGEDRTLEWSSKILPKGGLFFLEARTILDPLCGKGESKGKNVWFTDHYRRFIDSNEVIDKFKKLNFEVLFQLEQNNLAVYKDDNPVVLRLICRKL